MAALPGGIGGTFLDTIAPYEENARRGDGRPLRGVGGQVA
jgi:hypothetical protein